MEQARQQNGDGGRQTKPLRKNLRARQRKGGDRHIGEIIDDEIEALAVEARQDSRDVGPARERAVDAVDDECQTQPHEHLLPVTFGRSEQR